MMVDASVLASIKSLPLSWHSPPTEPCRVLNVASAFSTGILPLHEGERTYLTVERLSEEQARALVSTASVIRSFVGHEGTARVISQRLGKGIACERERLELDEFDFVLVAIPQMPRRLNPGEELSAEEVTQLEMTYLLVTRTPF